MSNLINTIQNLTNSEKELILYYSLVGVSPQSKNNYIANTGKSISVINQISYRLKRKGLLVKNSEDKLEVVKR